MYNEHFGFTEPPFKVTPDPRFFFVNPCYEEAFATLRYGIEARKGFVVVTGDAGTGKTALVKKLLRSFEPNVHTACINDPRLSFSELIQRALQDFGLPGSSGNRLAMMGQIDEYLVRQFERGHIVCLMIDEAQNLSAETLEELRLLSNLETHTDKLLQIILVGRPEFEEKLDQPEFFHLKQRVVLRCRLRPLQGREVGSYIDSRLKTVKYAQHDLFDAESIERIAFYSNGVPRLINIICDNALLIAYESSKRRVTAAIIEEVANGLKLSEGSQRMRQASVSELRSTVRDESFQTPTKKNSKSSMETNHRQPESNYFIPDKLVQPVFFAVPKSKRQWPRGIGVLLTLSVAGGAGTVLYTRMVGQESRFIQPTDLTPQLEPQIPADTGPEVPVRENLPQLTEDPNKDAAPVPETTVANESGSSRKTVDTSSKQNPEKTGEKRNARSINPNERDSYATGAHELEVEIYKAIHDRGISGVQVSVSDGTVYLNGRVATPRQKLAAVQATLSVPGVKRVQNDLIITG
jgi:type II secretory pathway predicted ATPase ExeA